MALTKREKLKMLVKVKLDELSPFDSLQGDDTTKGFIAADGDEDYDQVNPISSYIEETIDTSSEYCLQVLPLEMLSSDIEKDKKDVNIDNKGVGIVPSFGKDYRLVRINMLDGELDRDIVSFILPDDPKYGLQHNVHTRGGVSKPVSAYSPSFDRIEIYSFAKPWDITVKADIYYINVKKTADEVNSHIEDFIALRCAAYVLEYLGDAEKANVLMAEFENKNKRVVN